MKKNKGLIIGIVVALIIAAVAVWYFFFKKPSGEKLDTGTGNGTLDSDTIVRNAIIEATKKVTDNTVLTATEKEKSLYIIRTNVVAAKSQVMEKYVAGEDIVDFILRYTENVYNQYNTPIIKLSK